MDYTNHATPEGAPHEVIERHYLHLDPGMTFLARTPRQKHGQKLRAQKRALARFAARSENWKPLVEIHEHRGTARAIHKLQSAIAAVRGEPQPPFRRLFVMHPAIWEAQKADFPDKAANFEVIDHEAFVADLNDQLLCVSDI